jgi:hypothetical protein
MDGEGLMSLAIVIDTNRADWFVMGAFLFVWTFFWPGWGDVRPTWGIKHASLIRCLRAAEDRIRAGDDPRDVFADFGWTIDD